MKIEFRSLHTHTPHNNSLHVISLTGTVIMICNSRFFSLFHLLFVILCSWINLMLLCWFDLSEQSTRYILLFTQALFENNHIYIFIVDTFFRCAILDCIAIVIGYAAAVHCSFLSLAVFSDKREVNKIARHQYILVDISSRIFFRFGCFAAIIIVSCYCVTFSQWAFFLIGRKLILIVV